MTALVQNIALALIWAALTGEFTVANLLLGFALGAFLLWFGRSVTGRGSYFERGEMIPTPWQVLLKIFYIGKFVVVFLWEVVLANVQIMFTVLSPDMHLKPAIIALPLDIKSDVEVTLLANMITLTPGTLSMDLSDDHSILYVHVVSVGDPEDTRQELKTGFETLVYEVFKW